LNIKKTGDSTKFIKKLKNTGLFGLVGLLGDPRVSSVDVVLEELVLAKGGGADGALVGEVGGLQRLPVVLGHVVQQLPLVYLHKIYVKNSVSSSVTDA
jgi:hypothetical protein